MEDGAKVLVIDDDADDTEIFCDAIKEVDQRVQCIVAFSCEEALKKLRNEQPKPDFIFLDLNMPKMSGKECLLKLRETSACDGIAVIIYTTSKLRADMEETKKLGASFFLTKPTSLDLLKKQLSMILKREWLPAGK